MTGPKPPETATQAEYLRLLHRIAWLWMLAAVLIAAVASYRYYQDASAIENIANRDISQGWTITLLWVPLILQLLVLAFLGSRVRKEKRDDAVRHYFKFFYRNTGKASTAYAALWFGYTIWIGGNADSGVILALRWISLLGIIFLIYVVVKATYLITGSSIHRAKRLFREEDLDETKVKAISRKLRAAACAANGTKDSSPDAPHSQGPVSTQVRQIHRWLLKSRDYKVHRVAYKGNLDDLDMPHLVETLNSLVSSRDFYWATQEDGQIRDEPTLHAREAANRIYLEKYFVNDPPTAADQPTKSMLSISAAMTWLREIFDRLLGKQDRVDQQIGQRDGIRLFPFYTLIFFFSIFLCTAYLFAFAFAFEDKHVQLTDTKQQVALFMTDELLEDAPQQTDPALIRYSDLKNPSELVKKMREPRDSLGQYVNVRLTPRTKDLLQKEAAFDVPSGKLVNSLIYDLNALIKQESLYDPRRFDGVKLREGTRTLLNVIPTGRELTYLNRSLLEDAYADVFARMSEDYQLNRVQEKFFFQSGAAGLDVAAKDATTNEQHFIAQINKASLDTVVQELRSALGDKKTVRVEIIGRADQSDPAGNAYSSNSEVSASRCKTIRYAIQQRLIGANLSAARLAEITWVELPLSNDRSLLPKSRAAYPTTDAADNNGFLVVNDEFQSGATMRFQEMESLIESMRIDNLKEARPSSTTQVIEWWRRFREAAQKQLPTGPTVSSFNETVRMWIKASESDSRAAASAHERIERELYQLKNLNDSKRAVEVFIFESLTPRDNPQPNPPSKRMALMDYLYFAMYTITTTGYGDIKPVTPYAKFLCTLANMTEFFFIVVFFNTLLSLRRKNAQAS